MARAVICYGAIPAATNPAGVMELQNAVRWRSHFRRAAGLRADARQPRTRERADLKLGLSPRAGQGLMRAAQAWAFIATPAATLCCLTGRASRVPLRRFTSPRAARRCGEWRHTVARYRALFARCPCRRDRMRRWARQRIAKWARRRQGPDAPPFVIQSRRIYILPTKLGWGFSAMVVVMLIAGLNYANSAAMFLTFLLGGFGLVSMHQCHRNLLRATFVSAGAQPMFAGQRGVLRVTLGNEARFIRYGLEVGADLAANGDSSDGIARRRGCSAERPVSGRRCHHAGEARHPAHRPAAHLDFVSLQPVSRMDVGAPSHRSDRVSAAARNVADADG